MPTGPAGHKVNSVFTAAMAKPAVIVAEFQPMMGLALVMFIGLFAFGHEFLGWSDPGGNVQLGLFMAFLFGIVCGYRTKG